MSVKTKLARKAVKTTAKHTAHGAFSKLERKPLRSATLLVIGVAIGGLVGWLIGRSGPTFDDAYADPIAQAPAPPSIVPDNNSTESTSETGAVS